MAKIADLRIQVSQTRYCLVLLPFATYTRAGEVAKLTVFGIPVYRKVGSVRSVLGFVWGDNSYSENPSG